ncbi:hypothetical protein FRC01_003435 [Tulasnella sp. 417]|nr:hypothetical protein FRC01_003435 [Tulasnella sp. 417]
MVKTDEGRWNFMGQPSRQDWERFQAYATRVRRLDFKDFGKHTSKYRNRSLPLAEIPTLIAAKDLEDEPLLPNVKAITWSVVADIANLPRILPFISPSLKSLAFDVYTSEFEEDGDPTRQLFDGLTASPGLDLESFNFEKPEIGAEIVKRLLSFLERQPKLKVFGLSSDPYLEPRTVQSMLFSQLPTGLRELSADVEFHDESEYTALIQTILKRLPDLRVLKLVLTSHHDSWNLSDFKSFSPLLQNPNLEEMTLYVSGDIHLDTRDIYALGKALPLMTQFDLRLHYSSLPALKIQASSLMDFAKAFPNLRVLTTDISCTDIPLASIEGDKSAEPDAPNLSNLRILNVGASSLSQDDVTRMAKFLAMLGPGPLLEIEYDGKKKDSGDSVRPWRDVEAMLKLIRRPNLGGGTLNADRTPSR